MEELMSSFCTSCYTRLYMWQSVYTDCTVHCTPSGYGTNTLTAADNHNGDNHVDARSSSPSSPSYLLVVTTFDLNRCGWY